MTRFEPDCPTEPHVHIFVMPCCKCSTRMDVIHACSFYALLDEDSPTFDSQAAARRDRWLMSFGLRMAPTTTTGELACLCPECGASQGPFFVAQELLGIALDWTLYVTEEMPKSSSTTAS